VSFFDEDDEPTRRAPRPRRPAPAGGPRVDPQTLWMRRAIALGVGVLVIILLAVLINACQDSRRKGALRDYNREVATIVTSSDTEVGAPFFETLAQAASQSPEDLQTQISSLRSDADGNLDRAQELDVPDDLGGAQESLLIALELRRDGLQFIAERIATALGDEGDVADQAMESIAGQMQAFLASDVLLRTRVTPLLRTTLEADDVVADPAQTAGFMPSFDYLQPDFVAEQLGTRFTGGDSTGGGGTREVTPGLHGNGLVSSEVNGVALQAAPAANRVPVGTDTSFTVTFANQGENTEFDVEVLVTLQGDAGKDITGSATVDTIEQGTEEAVEIPLSRDPGAGELYTVNVAVQPVPGEKKTDNNESTYNVLFE
jgi:hypothetical protein